MTSIKATISRSAFLMLTLHGCNLFGQNSDFQKTVHKDLKHFGAIHPKGEEWEGEKKELLSTHSQEELASTLFAEVGSDHDASGMLNSSVRQLYHALDLPPALVCRKAEATDAPELKTAMMHILEGYKQPEVTAMLLRQLKDRRVAYTIDHDPDFEGPGTTMRVCDVACNVLSYNLEPDGSNNKITIDMSEGEKDKLIQETLTALHLSIPK